MLRKKMNFNLFETQLIKKMNFNHFETQKTNEFNRCTFFSARGSGPGPTFGFQGQNWMSNLNFGSVWSDRAGPAS